jgi:hypothetical protein
MIIYKITKFPCIPYNNKILKKFKGNPQNHRNLLCKLLKIQWKALVTAIKTRVLIKKEFLK